jgi:amidohydrolase
MTDWLDEVQDRIEAEAGRTVALGEDFRNHPELGFKETWTAARLADELTALGARVTSGLAVTGLKATVGDPAAPEIVLLADMDALPTAGTPGGVAHSCGHSAQMAAVVAAFRALVLAGVPAKAGARLSFVGAPAEEYTDVDHRLDLRRRGVTKLFSGKQELIRLGVFDDVCAVVKYHSMPDNPQFDAVVNGTLNGFVAKRATFLGKAAHSGAWPHLGINALNAASLAMLAIQAQRETFRDQDHIRVHPILREGGLVVNTVPDKAVLETYVRGATWDAIVDASAKVDRALAAGAVAFGAQVRIEDMPGYQPFRPSSALGAVLGEATQAYVDAGRIDWHDESFASDDVGDVASLVPTCQLGFAGFHGTIHGADFGPEDLRRAYVMPALILARTVGLLAADGGRLARSARDGFQPVFTKDQYVAAVEGSFADRTLAGYGVIPAP